MRRFPVLLSIAAMLVFGTLTLRMQPVAVAQDATPSADMAQEGITYEPVTFAQGVALPSSGDMFIVRIGLDPGARLPIDANDPTSGLLVVESGTLTINAAGPM